MSHRTGCQAPLGWFIVWPHTVHLVQVCCDEICTCHCPGPNTPGHQEKLRQKHSTETASPSLPDSGVAGAGDNDVFIILKAQH